MIHQVSAHVVESQAFIELDEVFIKPRIHQLRGSWSPGPWTLRVEKPEMVGKPYLSICLSIYLSIYMYIYIYIYIIIYCICMYRMPVYWHCMIAFLNMHGWEILRKFCVLHGSSMVSLWVFHRPVVNCIIPSTLHIKHPQTKPWFLLGDETT